MPDSPGYKKLATLNDMIHCMVYVVDTNNSSLLTQKMLDKFDAIRKKAIRMGECEVGAVLRNRFFHSTPLPAGIPQILLMTKVDKACSLVAEDLKTVYQSIHIQRKVNFSTAVVCDDVIGTVSVRER